MKKWVLGVVWQVMGFFGAIIILCAASPHQWDYHGITGIIGSLLGLDLMIPFVVCAIMFVVGVVISCKNIYKE